MLEGSVNIYLSCCPWQAPYTSSLILKPNTYSSRVACFFLGSLLAIHVLNQFQISPEVANQHNAMFRGLTSSPWLNFTATLRGRHYYLHIRNKETETQESWAHCSRSQSKEIANACLTPKTMLLPMRKNDTPSDKNTWNSIQISDSYKKKKKEKNMILRLRVTGQQ